MKITFFSTVSSKQDKTFDYKSFARFANGFKVCEEGGKHGALFVRGECIGERLDENLATSEILIVDGDYGKTKDDNAPAPKDVHEAVKKLGYNHFIYTSHSHSAEKNKFRLVVHTQIHERKHLVGNLNLLMQELTAKGVTIGFNKEMKSWSQPWFLPRRDNPADELFEYYEYLDGSPFELDYDAIETVETNDTEKTESNSTLSEYYSTIINGGEGVHPAMNALIWQYVNDGMSPANVKARIKALLEIATWKDTQFERWRQRYDEVDRSVDSAVAKITKEYAEFDYKKKANSNVEYPMPPGRLGQYIKEIEAGLLIPHPKIAFICGIGSLCAICGRRFNANFTDSLGLNMYFLLVARSGAGKNGLNKFFSKLFLNKLYGQIEGDYKSFYGPGSATGDKAIRNKLMTQRSMVMVTAEAGIDAQSKVGNTEGLRGLKLDAYTQSAYGGSIGEKAFSSEDNTMVRLDSPALTIIGESNPADLRKAYSDMDNLERGFLPRHSIYTILEPGKVTYNRDLNKYPHNHVPLSDDVVRQLEALMIEGKTCQASPMFEYNPIYVKSSGALEDEIWDYFEYMKAKGDNPADPFDYMYSRMGEKASKFAALCCIFNHYEEGMETLMLDRESWEWAKAMCDWETENIRPNLAFMSQDNPFEEAISSIVGKIVMITTGKRNAKVKKEWHEARVLPKSVLKNQTQQSSAVKALAGKLGKAGMTVGAAFDLCISEMEKQGIIHIHKTDPTGKTKSKDFIALLEGAEAYYGN